MLIQLKRISISIKNTLLIQLYEINIRNKNKLFRKLLFLSKTKTKNIRAH